MSFSIIKNSSLLATTRYRYLRRISGDKETEDTFIADLAVAIGAYGLKAGAPSERVRAVKYERLIEIEKERASVV